MDKYKVYNYRTHTDYEHGHGDPILETTSEQDAKRCADSSTYGGREICCIYKDGVEVYCTLHSD